jgi:uncharacterized protein YjbI with pentapeptide repeats
MKNGFICLTLMCLVSIVAGCSPDRECSLNKLDQLMPDLRDCNFDGADLTGYDFQNADLRGASFRITVLHGANLANAKLSGKWARAADLLTSRNGAAQDFNGWDLSYMNLANADLHNASLRGTNLEFAILSGANLRGADLTNAHGSSRGVFLNRADLTEAILINVDMEVSSPVKSYRSNFNKSLKKSYHPH